MRDRLPFFSCWAGQSIARLEGLDVGFFLGPFPPEDQEPGHCVKALLFFEIRFSPHRLPWITLYSSDPSERRLTPPQRLSTDSPNFDISRPVQVFLDRRVVENCVAYSVPDGWVEVMELPDIAGPVVYARHYGRVEPRWLS